MATTNTSHDLTETKIYRCFGLNGLRWYWWTYFPFLLACLGICALAIIWATPNLSQPQRLITQCVSLCLLFLGFYLTVRMWSEFMAGVSSLVHESAIPDPPENAPSDDRCTGGYAIE